MSLAKVLSWLLFSLVLVETSTGFDSPNLNAFNPILNWVLSHWVTDYLITDSDTACLGMSHES